MDGLAWDAVQEEFAFDGSWRDICVFRTDISDWQRMLDAIRGADYTVVYFRNDEATQLPGDASRAFPPAGECDRRLSVWFADVLANCHFFTVEEIEFDIDPREVKGQQQLDALFGFMRCLAQAVGKETVLTAENCPEVVIFRIRPENATIEYQPFGGWHDWRN
ncbi:MAG: hypothetical protein HY040_13885 [Planctomycetes bacterium]|nr:hypothetical protein [Planctomycetota bacterium]